MWVERLTASFTRQWSGKRLLDILLTTDVRALLSSCKEADGLLLQAVDVGYPYDYASFKRLLKDSNLPTRLVGELKGMIAYWFESMNHNTLLTLRDLLLFPTKVNLSLVSLEEEALEEYLSHEEWLRTREIEYTCEEQDILSNWFSPDLEWELLERIIPKHGNGSVAEGPLLLYEKYRTMRSDGLLRYFAIRTHETALRLEPGLLRQARVAFVPKTYKGYRTISMEPATLMFWQEGVWNAFCSMQQDGLFGSFRKRYNPDSQDPNRDLALLGSIAGRFTTIDLHAASDSVTWDLVQQWFRKTCFFRALYCTRSREAKLPNGSVVTLKKFAPMGSAVNFLVECAVFSAITEAAISEQGGDPARSAYRVYGDDIVVETKFAQGVIDRLERNGFVVNATKSYQYGCFGFFRESCGIHCFNGHDVTPLVCSRRFDDYSSKRLSPATIAAMIDQCNAFYKRHYRLARGVLLHRLMKLPQGLRPAFGYTESCVQTPMVTNHHLIARDNKNYQTPEVLHGTMTGPSRCQRYDEELEEFLRRNHDRNRVEEPCIVDTAVRRCKTRWTSKWTPTEVFTYDPLAQEPV
jgi:hypothetical protein